MFNSVLNYAPATYEAIILAFIAVGLIQVVALRRKWHQGEQLKRALGVLAVTSAKAIANVFRESALRIARLSAENAQLTQEVAEWQRAAMEASADRDEAVDELEAARAAHDDVFERNVSGGHTHDDPRNFNPSELFERIFGVPGGTGGIDVGGPGELVASFTLDKDGKLTPLDDKSFEFVNDTGIHGGTFNREPGAPDLNVGDLLAGIRAVNARRRLDRHPLEDLLFGGTTFQKAGRVPGFHGHRDPGEPPHPVFDNDESTKANLSKNHDENCDTQRGSDYEPRSYPSSSPRAG